MSSPVDSPLQFWQSEWERVFVQLDPFTHMIKINYDIYYLLGEGGRDFFVSQASTLLNRQMEFFIDDSNERRVFLANRGDLQAIFPCRLEQLAENRLPRFFPMLHAQHFMTRSADYPPASTQNESGSTTSSTKAPTYPDSSHAGHFMQQSLPVNFNFRRTSVNMNINFTHPQAQLPITSASIRPWQNMNLQSPTPNFSMSTSSFRITPPAGAPKFQAQTYSMIQPQNMSARHTPTGNTKACSLPKSSNERKPDGQGHEELERRGSIRAANPGIANGRVSIVAAEEWGALSPDDKNRYYERADQLAIEHIQQHPNSCYKPDMEKIARRREERAQTAAARAAREAMAKGQEPPQTL
ncbi:hypothetical protein F5Y12DRAFT_718273 [Xylaria sp. FL1777]|nr:hypothetical protein F5Y12DRAFT_718273 [Xylaria sp. FL1777]